MVINSQAQENNSDTPVKGRLAIVRDNVYIKLSSKDDKSRTPGKGTSNDVQNDADTTPHQLTDNASQDAETLQEAFAPVVEELKHDISTRYDKATASGPLDRAGQLSLATTCARLVIAVYGFVLQELNENDQNSTIGKISLVNDESSAENDFRDTLDLMLRLYLLFFSEPEWVPRMGFIPEDDNLPPMAAWVRPDNRIVCDMLALIDPRETDAALWATVGPALDAAAAAYGPRFAAIRLLPPFGHFRARLYFPDGTWEPI